MESAEREVLLRWKKRSDTLVLIRLKAEAILYASGGVDLDFIAEMVGRTRKTVLEWLSQWRVWRLGSVVTGHQGNENAAKLTRAQKEEVAQLLQKPPSEAGISAEFWDIPALSDVVSSWFGVEYESESSYRLLMKFAGMSFKLADPFDKRRDERAIAKRMREVKAQFSELLAQGFEVYTVDEVRVEHESETRRMWLPQGQRTKIHVDRERAERSFFGALSLTTGAMKTYPIDGNQNTEQMILMFSRLQRETPQRNIAVVLDNARFHHAKLLVQLFEPGQELERITPIFLPPYAPDHNPTDHVWNAAKGAIANLQRETPENTFSAFMNFTTSRTFDYDFEHLPIIKRRSDFVQFRP
jgi:transposase